MTTVDWTRPIEAVAGKTVMVARVVETDCGGDRRVAFGVGRRYPFGLHWFNADGAALGKTGISIRNTPAPEQFAEYANNALPPALVERMAALVRNAAQQSGDDLFDEARAIVAELPEVDTTAAIARRLVADEWPDAAPENEHALIRAAWLGLKHGQLEREGL